MTTPPTPPARPPLPPCRPLVDTHAHLQDEGLAADLPQRLREAKQAGVEQIIAIGITAADSRQVVDVASSHLGVFAAVGFQPNHVVEAVEGDWGTIVELAARPRVVAIGETGLDRHWDTTPFAMQQEWFGRHLELAGKLDLPVVIHCRECEADVVAQIAALGRPVRGVLHSFTGTVEQARAFLDLGLHVSFAGMVTFTSKKNDALREAARSVPLDRILVETDSPYLSPHPLRGRPNQPSHIHWTARVLAEAHGLPADEMARITTANARALFRLPADDVLNPPRGRARA